MEESTGRAHSRKLIIKQILTLKQILSLISPRRILTSGTQ